MIIRKHQQGVGLMEVLVALLLLAIGVLGYTALQLRAVDASAEAMSRSQGMLILRGLAENIRANPLLPAERGNASGGTFTETG